MSQITYLDKSQSKDYDPSLWNAQDANEVKKIVNQKDDLILGQQSAHGFSIGEGVYQDSSGWHRSSNANNSITSRVDGVVINVTDADNFVVGKPGTKFTLSSALTADTPYLLGSGNPNYTTTEPSTMGQIRQVLFVTSSTTQAAIILSEPFELSSPNITDSMLNSDIKIGSLAALTTTAKSSIIAAINELKSMIDAITGGGTGGGGSVLRTFYLNFNRSDQGSNATSPWNNTDTAYQGWTNIGGVAKANMTDSTGTASTVSATNPAALTGVGGITLNTTGADLGVWPDAVIGYIAQILSSGTYRFTGLDDTKHYNFYFHFDTNHYDGLGNVHATIGSQGSTPVGSAPAAGGAATPRNPNGNHGEGQGTGLANTALDYIKSTSPTSGTIDITFTNDGDNTSFVPVSSIVIEETA